MKTKIQSVQRSLDKVDEWVARVLSGEFPENGQKILSLLAKREKILNKTMRKLRRFNQDHLVGWQEIY